jgi:hypothetical protein
MTPIDGAVTCLPLPRATDRIEGGRMMDLVRYLWRGDVPLVKTYWLFGVAGGFLFRIALRYIEYQGRAFESGLAPILVLGLVLLSFSYTAFICVAIWRSANKYQGLKRYPILAKFIVIWGAMATIKSALDLVRAISPT